MSLACYWGHIIMLSPQDILRWGKVHVERQYLSNQILQPFDFHMYIKSFNIELELASGETLNSNGERPNTNDPFEDMRKLAD